MGKIMVGALSRSARDGMIRFEYPIKGERYQGAALWWDLPQDVEHFVAGDRLDAALLGLLFPAMMYGDDIHLEGVVSERLIFNINAYTIPLMLDFFHSLKPITVTADGTVNNSYGGAGVGTGFSAGVDSIATIIDRYERESFNNHKVNTLLFMNAGSHASWLFGSNLEPARKKFLIRLNRLKDFAGEMNLPLVPIDTNLHLFNKWGHEYTHPLKAAATVVLMQKHFSKYFYSSAGLDYDSMMRFQSRYRGRDIGAWCDPILLPQISTESLEMISDGCAYTRFEKVERIANFEPSRRYLNVCVDDRDDWSNCSLCDKCMRTMLSLDVLQKREEFTAVFDWATFDKLKSDYVDSQVVNVRRDPFAADAISAARLRGYPLPNVAAARARQAARLTARGFGKLARKLKGN